MIVDRLKQWLTFNYDKSPSSKISKILEVISQEFEQIKFTFRRIEEWNDVDNAEGVALDEIGQNILQFRGETTDDVYRVLIRSKIARDRATGTYNNMLEVLSLALETPLEDVVIEEGTHPIYQTIKIVKIPIGKLAEIGMTASQLGRIVASLTAAGVGVESIEFFGTFEYVAVLENNLNLGYSDVGMTNGGTLGGLFQPQDDPNFPI